MSKQDKKKMIAALAMVLATTQFGGSLTYAQTDLSLLTEEELVRFHNSIIQNEKSEYDGKMEEMLPEEEEVFEEEFERELEEEFELEEKFQEDVEEEVEVEAVAEGKSVNVSTNNDFFKALEDSSVKTIVVTKRITLVNSENAGTDYDLTPINIRGDVTIKGKDENSVLTFRTPMQLTGDNVKFENIEMNFISSDAMGGVPHREIFLAGHSLTFDDVNCYTQGASGSLGGFGSSEPELLPEVYAGGYRGANLGNHAKLTVENANGKTMFKAIHTGHDKSGMTPYTGRMTLKLDAKTVVREGVFADENTENVDITFHGSNKTSVRSGMKVFGNAHTTVNFDNVSASEIIVDGVENIELKNNAIFEPKAGDSGAVLKNISVPDGTTLDLHSMNGTIVQGDFVGGGTLMLDTNDTLRIQGDIQEQTKFQTGNMLNSAGNLVENKAYIIAEKQTTEDKFTLSPVHQDYKTVYENNKWSVKSTKEDVDRVFSSMEIISGHDAVSINKLGNKGTYQYIIQGKDTEGVRYFPYLDTAVVPADYIENPPEEKNWAIPVYCYPTDNYGDEDYNGSYDLYSLKTDDNTIQAGKYAIIFVPEGIDSNDTVKDILKKSNNYISYVTFYKESDADVQQTTISQDDVTIIEEHQYTGQPIKPEVTVEVNGTPLVNGTDFIVTYTNNINVNKVNDQGIGKKAVIQVEGIGKYKGTVTKEFDIVKADAGFGISTDKQEYTYGDKITFTFTAKPEKKSRRSRRSVEVRKDEVAFLYNGEVLGKSYVTNGQATFAYDTKKNIIQPDAGEINKITVRYGGSDTLEKPNADAEVSVTPFTIKPLEITKDNIESVVLEDIVYDGTRKETNIKDVIWKDTVEEKLSGVYLKGTATLSDANAGDKTQANIKDLKIVGDNANWYTLSAEHYDNVKASGKILKAEAPNNVHDTQIVQLSGGNLEHSIDFSEHLPKDIEIEQITAGQAVPNQDILVGAPSIDQDKKLLKFTRKRSEKSEFSIPIMISFKNYKDMEIRYHFIVTDEVKVDLNLQAPNMIYSGQSYSGWSVKNAQKDDLDVTFYDVTKDETLGNTAPTNVGKYRIDVKLKKDGKIGEASKEFAITPKEVKLTAKSQTIKVGDNLTDLSNPVKGKHFDVNVEGVNIADLGTVKMWYDRTLNVQNPQVGTYQINIGVLPDETKQNYKATGVAGELKITSEDVPTPPVTKYSIKVTNGTAGVEQAAVGEEVTITANEAAPGEAFVKWQVNKGKVHITSPTNPETTFTIQEAGEVEIEAIYKKVDVTQKYTVSVIGGKSSVKEAAEGETVTITAEEPVGQTFVRWDVKTGNVQLAEPTEKEITFQMPKGDVKIEAIYEKADVTQKYTVSVIGGKANVEKAAEGETVTITAEEPVGKTFVRWNVTSGNVELTAPTQKETTFTMPANAVSIEAEYKVNDKVPTNNVILSSESMSLRLGNTAELTATVLPEEASDKSVAWSVTGDAVEVERIAGKESTVKIVSKKTGDAVITVTTNDGNHTATCKVNVYRKSSGGGSSSSSSSNKPNNTTKNPDGSQTTITQNKDGATVEVTKRPNGEVETVVKDKDGTVTNTQTKPDGTKTETTFATDGKINSTVTLPEKSDKPNTTDKKETQAVTIPDVPKDAGMVAVIVDENGNKQVVKYSYATEDGLVVALSENAKLEIYDNSKDFKDVTEHAPYKDAVDFVTSHELFFGTKKDKFSPDTSMTRAMFAEVMYRLEDKPATGNGIAFTDVKKSDYFANAVAWASQNDIINGMGDGKFVPNKPITKEELLVMLHQLKENKGDAKTENKENVSLHNVSPWAAESVNWAVQNGIITTENGVVMAPKAYVSRAEVATILLNYVKS